MKTSVLTGTSVFSRCGSATRSLIAALAVASVVATAQATPAAAYVEQATGSAAHVTGYQLQGSHFDTCPTTAYSCWNAWIYGNGPTVYRSPATYGRQQIAAVYQLQFWTGSVWVQLATRSHVRFMAAGYNSLQMPRVDFLPNRAGTFRVNLAIAWRTHDGSRLLGSRALGYVKAGDYACNTRFPCQAGPDWVWLRSPHV